MTFTFKKGKKPTGLYAVGHPNPDTVIKLRKMQVGTIYGPSWLTKDGMWRVGFMVKDPESHCGWKNITLKKKTSSEAEMREWLKEMYSVIINTYEFHALEIEED